MKKYQFLIHEINDGMIIVKANSQEKAREKAVEYWDNGDVKWNGYSDVRVEFVKEVKE